MILGKPVFPGKPLSIRSRRVRRRPLSTFARPGNSVRGTCPPQSICLFSRLFPVPRKFRPRKTNRLSCTASMVLELASRNLPCSGPVSRRCFTCKAICRGGVRRDYPLRSQGESSITTGKVICLLSGKGLRGLGVNAAQRCCPAPIRNGRNLPSAQNRTGVLVKGVSAAWIPPSSLHGGIKLTWRTYSAAAPANSSQKPCKYCVSRGDQEAAPGCRHP